MVTSHDKFEHVHYMIGREVNYMAKHTKKDGGTKQKGKNKPKNKTSSSANGQNGYH